MLMLSPYIFGFAPHPDDSLRTTVEFGAGKGSYAQVSRDCSGNVTGVSNAGFRDAAIGIDHRISDLNFGVKGGVTHYDALSDSIRPTPDQTVKYINPYVGFRDEFVGMNFGIVILASSPGLSDASTRDLLKIKRQFLPSVALRLGFEDAWYFSTSYATNVPLNSGGGLYDVGFGFPAGDPLRRIWVGWSFMPYDEGAFSLKGDFPLSERFILATRGQVRLGDAFEYGLSMGGKVRF